MQRGTPRLDETHYTMFLRAFNLRDLVDVPPVPVESQSCFQGPAHFRVDTVACYTDATIAVASYQCWGSTLLSDHHVPLLFTLPHQVVQLEKPCPDTVSGTPAHHLGPVALYKAHTADFRAQCSGGGTSTPKLPQCAIENTNGTPSMIERMLRAGSKSSASGATASACARRRGPPSRRPGTCHSRHAASFPRCVGHRGGPKHGRGLRDNGTRPEAWLGSAQESSVPPMPLGSHQPVPPTIPGDQRPSAHPSAAAGGPAAQPGPPHGVPETSVENKVLLNQWASLSALYASRMRL